MKRPRISVAMATYNGEKYIKEQIDSIMRNMNADDELIISDDNSSDDTVAIVEAFNDKRIRVLKGPCKGVSANFENALINCCGDIIFLCDQDDIWKDDKVECILKEFASDSELVLVEHDATIIDAKKSELFPSYFKYRKVRRGFLHSLIRSPWLGCTMAFKRGVLSKILPFPEKCKKHDRWIGLICETNGGCKLIDKKLSFYRRHDNNVSFIDKKDSIIIQVIERVSMLIWVVKRSLEKE